MRRADIGRAQPYTPASEFRKAGIAVASTAAQLAGLAQQDAGIHLVAFDRWRPNLMVAHLFISTDGAWPPVLVIDSDEVTAR